MKTVAKIGPKNCYTKRKKVKETIHKLKTIEPNIVILSGGNGDGIEKDVKETALNFGLRYKEFNPAFTQRNDYSMMDEKYFGKKYHFTHLMERYTKMLQFTDVVIVGYDEGSTVSKEYLAVLKSAEKKKKKIVFI